MRFDDTNPEKEDTEYVNSILDAVQWLGFNWDAQRPQPPVPGQRLLRLHVPRGGIFDRSRPRLCGRADRRADAPEPRRLRQARQSTAPSAPARRPRTWRVFRDMRDGQYRRRLHGAARQDRHGQPQHQHARPGHLPHPPRHAPQHRRHLVHLPDVHLRAPDRGRAGADHPQHLHARIRRPAPVLRLAAGAPDAKAACWPARPRTSTNLPG